MQPDNVLMHLNLGLAYQEVGQTQQAYEAFRRAVALKPDNPEALRLAASAAINLGRLDEARRDLEAARRLVPRHRGIQQMLQDLDTRMGTPTPAPQEPAPQTPAR